MKKLLITISYKIKTADGKFWKEAYMFVIANIKYGVIYLPEDHTIDEEEARAYAEQAKVPLATYLERLIMNTPELLEACKRHRVGYKQNTKSIISEVPTSQEIESQNWTAFLIKVLFKKKDIENARRIQRYGTFQFPKAKLTDEQK